nr:LysR family transcriptional regulator substrate-binding protein [Shewanella sp. Isolate11]
MINHEQFHSNQVHIAMNQGVAVRLVREIISDYFKEHSHLSLKISTIASPQSIENFRGDFAITTTSMNNPNFIYHVIDDMTCYFVASLDYLDKHGEPQTIEDLSQHNVIVTPIETVNDGYFFCETFDGLKCQFKLVSSISVDSKFVSDEFVLSGDGIGLIPSISLAAGKYKNVKTLFNGTIQSKSLVQVAVKQNTHLSPAAKGLMDKIVNNFSIHYV